MLQLEALRPFWTVLAVDTTSPGETWDQLRSAFDADLEAEPPPESKSARIARELGVA